MCQFKSLIIKRDCTVLDHPEDDSHTSIEKRHGLVDNEKDPDKMSYCKIEVISEDWSAKDFAKCNIIVDEKRTPKWFGKRHKIAIQNFIENVTFSKQVFSGKEKSEHNEGFSRHYNNASSTHWNSAISVHLDNASSKHWNSASSVHRNNASSEHWNNASSEHYNNASSEHSDSASSKHFDNASSKHWNSASSKHWNDATSEHYNFSVGRVYSKDCKYEVYDKAVVIDYAKNEIHIKKGAFKIVKE
jgi:hypothetical protein